ncbi:MAG: glycosyltransferase family 39 protein [Bacteroidales bacterium]|nr:glycosyltransferase family 39 protein [Bacteroidales bacterium]
MLRIIKNNKLIVLPYLVILLIGIAIAFSFDKATIHLTINKFHNHFFDFFFKYLTYLGNGYFAVLVVCVLLFIKFRHALIIGYTALISGLAVQILKQIIFSDSLRPLKFFEGTYKLYLINGVNVHSLYSFPSGHTATAFSVFMCLAIIYGRKYTKVLMLFLAVLVGYSRIYLSQHFLNDVLIGSAIGTFFALLFCNIMEKQENTWLDKSIMHYANYRHILIILFAAALYIPFLGNVNLFDWDEINFAEAAREMITTNDYLTVKINYLPFWEKPPLFIWMQAASMNIFGINEFAARLPNALCGIITLLILFNIGKKTFDEKFGFIWALAFGGAVLPFLYFKSGIIDSCFNLFIFIGVYCFFVFSENIKENKKHISQLLLSAIFIGLAILTKGPAALVIFIIAVVIYLFATKQKNIISLKHLLLFLFIVVIIGGLWFLIQICSGKYYLIVDFLKYQLRLFNTKDSGHGGFLLYHFIVLLFGVFPSSVIALKGFGIKNNDNIFQNNFKKLMMILFIVVLVIFSVVKTKIIHYSSLCYFPLSFLAAYTICKFLKGEIKWNKWMSIILIVIALIIGILEMSLQFIIKFKNEIINSGFIKDKFAVECLKADVSWSGYEFIPGLILIIGTITSLIILKKNKLFGVVLIYLTSIAFTAITMFMIIPKVDKYIQGTAIDFYKSKQNCNCYVETVGFKSYAHLFYAKKEKPQNKNASDMQWLISGNIDKPVFFVCKINDADNFQKEYPQIKLLNKRNGYAFFMREVK